MVEAFLHAQPRAHGSFAKSIIFTGSFSLLACSPRSRQSGAVFGVISGTPFLFQGFRNVLWIPEGGLSDIAHCSFSCFSPFEKLGEFCNYFEELALMILFFDE
jgi:hypothetical protein